ncbi:hypothetical protein [Corynebacterium sp. A21]|uniref:hypothetical protein n=1 Tax=Corynebacterium sp. A21 TaxID=3457318 RepID=UPI003FD5E3E9
MTKPQPALPETAVPKILYDRESAAYALSIGTTALDEERRAGRLAAVRFRRSGIRFRHDDLVRWAETLPED